MQNMFCITDTKPEMAYRRNIDAKLNEWNAANKPMQANRSTLNSTNTAEQPTIPPNASTGTA